MLSNLFPIAPTTQKRKVITCIYSSTVCLVRDSEVKGLASTANGYMVRKLVEKVLSAFSMELS